MRSGYFAMGCAETVTGGERADSESLKGDRAVWEQKMQQVLEQMCTLRAKKEHSKKKEKIYMYTHTHTHTKTLEK
jgi:hypothetical protein